MDRRRPEVAKRAAPWADCHSEHELLHLRLSLAKSWSGVLNILEPPIRRPSRLLPAPRWGTRAFRRIPAGRSGGMPLRPVANTEGIMTRIGGGAVGGPVDTARTTD